MLILTRKRGQSIYADEHIQFKVLDVNGNQVKIGIEAPKEVSVHREEIHLKIKAEREAKIIADLEDEGDCIDEEVMSQLIRKFGRSANDESITNTKIHN